MKVFSLLFKRSLHTRSSAAGEVAKAVARIENSRPGERGRRSVGKCALRACPDGTCRKPQLTTTN